MKKIFFNRLSIKNFLSVGESPVVLKFRPGLHGITGINKDQLDRRNGVGKSTITDALHFALFGTTLRELKKEFIVNNITSKTCEVSLSFSVSTTNKEAENYEIIRTLEPSRCTLYHNDLDITRDSIVNTTEYVMQLLQCTPEIFQNCVIMTVNNTVPFMAKKKAEKRKFIESIFNLEIFSKMLSQLRDEQSTVRKDHDTECTRCEEIQNSINTLTTQQTTQHKEYEDRKRLLLDRQKDNNQHISILEKNINNYKSVNVEEVTKNLTLLSEKLNNTDIKIQDLGKQVATLETKNELIFTSMSKIGTDKEVCPTCLRIIADQDATHISHTKNEYVKEIKQREKEIKDLDAKISELSTLKTKIQDAIKKGQNNISQSKLAEQQLTNDKSKLDQLKKLNDQVDQDLQHLTDTSTGLTKLIEDAKQKHSTAKEKLDNLQKVLNLLDTVKFVVSEEGVKSFIVKKILKLFNSKITYYLKKLNSNAIITFNEYFEEQIVNDKGKLTTYFNFSGAERKVIDLAIMFSFIDMLSLQGNIYYNVQFYDELLDTSLDEAGVDLVLNLLNEFVTKNMYGIYVITHRKECTRFVTGNMICLEKNNGITTLTKSGIS